MVEGIRGLARLLGPGGIALEAGGISDISPSEGARDLLLERLLVSELLQKRLVQQILDILGVVEGGGSSRALVDFLAVVGLAREDTLPDAQLSEVGQADLQLLDGLVSGDVVLGRTSLALLLYPTHFAVGVFLTSDVLEELAGLNE